MISISSVAQMLIHGHPWITPPSVINTEGEYSYYIVQM